MDLNGKVIIVTGGASGIGRATAFACAQRGARVIVTDINKEAGRRTADNISNNAEFRHLDVTELEKVEEIINKIATNIGLDVIVNNAGLSQLSTLEETTIEERDNLIDVNLKGVWNGCRAAVPHLRKQGSGSIINMASVGGLRGGPKLATYSATKAAVVNFTRALAAEVGPEGIRANAICPGTIKTPLIQEIAEEQGNPEEALAASRDAHLLKRLGKPEEVAECAVFLASDSSSFITGSALVVDGGLTAVSQFR